MKRLVVIALAVTLMSCGTAEKPEYRQPPIIIVDVDTLRADHLGCYGYQRATSPNIDAFSRETAFFQWAFAQAPNTAPSKASILTGLYPTSHGRINHRQKVPDRFVTLAESLRAAGYATAAFVDGGMMVSGFGLEQGFDLYDDNGGGVGEIGPKAERWIRQRLAPPATRDEPFLLLVHTYDTHSPYEITPKVFKAAFLDEGDEPSAEFRKETSKAMEGVWKAQRRGSTARLTPTELEYAVALYDGGILHVDAWFGEFVGYLKAVGVYDQAIIVFISDHGDEFQEHGGLFHERLYATVTRIPLMIRFPGQNIVGSFEQMPVGRHSELPPASVSE